jgi:two-component system CitB family sensor kinase
VRGRERKRRLSTRILLSQLLILALTSGIGFVLLTFAQRAEIDRQYENEALSIAQAAASDPVISAAMAAGGPDSEIQAAADRITAATSASYVVVIDTHRVRHSHPMHDLVGRQVEEPIVVLDGRGHVGIDDGATGRSANGKAPLYGPGGVLIGEVSVGIRESTAVGELWRELPVFGLFAGIALALGAIASALLARRLKRSTFGLELEEIAGLLQDREAMLHGIREGVIAFDPRERISLVNDEARRLLGLGSALGCRLEELLPEGRLRSALDGTLTGGDLVVLTDGHCLAVNRMPVVLHGRRLGAVVTVRDRTEMVGLLRELDSVRGLTDALRSQQHEFSNRMHTLAGLLELGEHEAAREFAVGCAGAEPALTESVRERIGNPTMVGLIVAKTTVAAERGVELTLDQESALSEEPAHLNRLLTIVGNLVDNAVDAVASGGRASGSGSGSGSGIGAGAEPGRVRLRLVEHAGDAARRRVVVRVEDNGPGIPPDRMGRIFQDGWSTKPERGTARRGLGLALVHRLVQRHGGTIDVRPGPPGAVFTVVLPLPADGAEGTEGAEGVHTAAGIEQDHGAGIGR